MTAKYWLAYYVAGYFHGTAVCALLGGFYWEAAKIGSAGTFIIIAMIYFAHAQHKPSDQSEEADG